MSDFKQTLMPYQPSRFGPLGLQPFWYTPDWPVVSQLDDGITIPPKPIRRQQPQPVRCSACLRVRLAVLKAIRHILFGKPQGKPNTSKPVNHGTATWRR